MRNRILSLLGLATRSGNLVSGEFMTEKAVKGRKAFLVIVSREASDNTKKKFSDSCRYYRIPYVEFGDKEMLGSAIGKQFRASLAVTDTGFAKSLGKKLNLEVTEHGEDENI